MMKRIPKANTTALKRQINRMVHRLCDLTPEETAVVEEGGHK